ncbi:MAG: alpha/beta hydrolase [Candidatus Woesearchaeota archaeon]
MNPNIIIIHGSYGNPNHNWFPWLKEELEKLNCRAFVPEFPTPKNQNLNTWLNIFKNYETYLDENSILVGHSIACAFILSILEKINIKIKASFLVAGFIGPLGNEYYDSISKTFTQKEFNWGKIKSNCSNFFVYSSDNDPHVQLSKGHEIAKNLDSKLILVKNAGHFNTQSSYTKFELLLDDIKRVISKL